MGGSSSADKGRRPYQSIVVGSGPGGLATVCALLDQGVEKIAWVDSRWTGGRLNGMYREISSNTKVGIYLDALKSSTTCQAIIDSAEEPNAVTEMQKMDLDSTAKLSFAGDMIIFLQKGLLGGDKVDKFDDEVEELEREGDHWVVKLKSGTNLSSDTAHLCTGSHPRELDLHKRYNDDLTVLNLDNVLRKSMIPKLLGIPGSSSSLHSSMDKNAKSPSYTIGVIGNSHSGVLAIWNLYQIANEHNINMTIVSFERRPILYAEYRDDGIVHDNTGLKGATSDWSKEVMESSNPGQGRIKRVQLGHTSESESAAYEEWLPQCTHLVYAVGYDRNGLPRVVVDGKRVEGGMQFDMHTSGFHFGEGERIRREKAAGGDEARDLVPRLYGCGIAFPEEVEDPEGNVEAAVGFAKFFKFAERVKAIWAPQ